MSIDTPVVGMKVKVSASARTSLGGEVYWGEEVTGTITYVSPYSSDVNVKSDTITSRGRDTQTVDKRYLTLVPDIDPLDAYKTKVRDAVIAEADKRGWCDDVDLWLESLDLEPRTLNPFRKAGRGSVAGGFGSYHAVKTGDNNWSLRRESGDVLLARTDKQMTVQDGGKWKVVYDPSNPS